MTKKRKPKKSKLRYDGDSIPTELIDALIKDRGRDNITGPDGLLKELTGALVSRLMEQELTEHLDYEPGEAPPEGQQNRRNGHRTKRVRSEQGELEVRVPRDRDGNFSPHIVKPHERHFNGFDDKIIAMYGRGMTVRDIQKHIAEIYAVDVSHDFISRATDAVLDELEEWQNAPLEAVYPVIWVDALRVKTRENGFVENRAVYLAMGLNCSGERSVLGMWVEKNEGAGFWTNVFSQLQKRGVQDVFFLCADGLKGMSKAVEAIFPHAIFQTCVVHMIRSSTMLLPYDRRREACRDLKKLYTAIDIPAAEKALLEFEEKWKTHPFVAKPWRERFEEWAPFLDFPKDIRKIIYTTNAVEALIRQIRKVIKNRGAFPNDVAAEKLIYLALKNAEGSWSKNAMAWRRHFHQLSILFPKRMPHADGIFI